MAWWSAQSPHSKRIKIPAGSFCVEHVLPVYAWVLSGYSGFLPPPENMHVRLTGDSKLSVGVSVSVHGCVSLCGPAMDWRPVQGVPCVLPNDNWDSLQSPPATLNGLSKYRKWMDGCSETTETHTAQKSGF